MEDSESSLTYSNMQNALEFVRTLISNAGTATNLLRMNIIEGRSARLLCNFLDTVILLVSMGWMAQLACVSMITVAQRRPQNHAYRTRLFMFGVGWGMLLGLLEGWSLLATPWLGLLVGILNSNLPYIHYVTEITRYTDWAYRV